MNLSRATSLQVVERRFENHACHLTENDFKRDSGFLLSQFVVACNKHTNESKAGPKRAGTCLCSSLCLANSYGPKFSGRCTVTRPGIRVSHFPDDQDRFGRRNAGWLAI